MIMVIVPLAVVVVAVAALVGVKVLGIGKPDQVVATGAADPGVISQVTSVPESTLNEVGVGSVTSFPKATNGEAVTEDGKPKVLYVGAEYCPYCASERWGMVVALSRFGTFSDLGVAASSAEDVYPSTQTLSFHNSSYTSSTLAFSGVETQSDQGVALDTLTADEQQLVTTYNSGGSIPFIDIGGKYTISGASYSPQVLQGKSRAEIAAALSDPDSNIAKGVDGTANVITAAICATTNNQPANVCNAAGVQAAKSNLS